MVAGAYFIPLYFQYVHQDSALKAAVRLLPFIVVLITCITLNGGLLPVVGYYYPWFLASGIFTTIGGALMYTVDVDTSTTKIYGYSVLMVASSGLVGQAGYAVAQAKVSLREVSAAISFMNVAQLRSIVLALTIAGSVFRNVAIHDISAALAGQGFTVAEIKSSGRHPECRFSEGVSRGAACGTQSSHWRDGQCLRTGYRGRGFNDCRSGLYEEGEGLLTDGLPVMEKVHSIFEIWCMDGGEGDVTRIQDRLNCSRISRHKFSREP